LPLKGTCNSIIDQFKCHTQGRTARVVLESYECCEIAESRQKVQGGKRMYCSQCGTHVKDGEHFCSNCGASLQKPAAVRRQAPGQEFVERDGGRRESTQDPYQEQIQELRLHIRQLKLDLKKITTSMSSTRSHYYQTRAFLPRAIRKGSKWFEDFRLLGKQPQKEQLQQEIANRQQELLGLEEAQVEWKRQQNRRPSCASLKRFNCRVPLPKYSPAHAIQIARFIKGS
jgi:hypothetical protein